MTSKDKKLIKKQERALERIIKAEKHKEKVIIEMASTSASSVQFFKQSLLESSSSESSGEDDSSDEFQMPYKCPKLGTQNAESSHFSPSSSTVFTKHVLSALDRNKITNREAVRLMIPLAAELGYDPTTLPISRSTIRRRRKKARIQFNNEVRGTFAPEYPLVVHWDGKILPDILGNQKVDCLPDLVSGDSEEKLLPSNKCQRKVKSLRVVNDTAERGVKLFKEYYNKALMKDGEEKQFILQLVEKDRKIIPTQTTKHSLLKVVLNKEK